MPFKSGNVENSTIKLSNIKLTGIIVIQFEKWLGRVVKARHMQSCCEKIDDLLFNCQKP
jgi:hypothetical protein